MLKIFWNFFQSLKPSITVYVGGSVGQKSDRFSEYQVQQITIHEGYVHPYEYTTTTMEHDLALVKLDTPVRLDQKRKWPICLPSRGLKDLDCTSTQCARIERNARHSSPTKRKYHHKSFITGWQSRNTMYTTANERKCRTNAHGATVFVNCISPCYDERVKPTPVMDIR